MTNDEIQNLEVAPKGKHSRPKVCPECHGVGVLLINNDAGGFENSDCVPCDGTGVIETRRPNPTIDEEAFRPGLNIESISSHKLPLDCIQFMKLKRNM